MLNTMLNYAAMTDADIAAFGLDAGETVFAQSVEAGATNGNSLYIRAGIITANGYNEWGCRAIGPNADEFAKNIGPEDGKLATVLKYADDTIVASRHFNPPEGPQSWTGGVIHRAMVQVGDKWRDCAFVGAASGVQGHFDMATVYTVLTHMGAAWALRERAQAGL
jgi:hypothetical protein